jgi:uncharacterized protein YdeI (YjbR/CyaY-like superfamily)
MIGAAKANRDEEKSLQRYTPRRPGSIWSARNKAHIARLTSEGRMTPAGLAKIEAAKRDGSWNRLKSIDVNPETPPDLVEAMQSQPEAKAAWDKMAPSHRKQYSWWNIDAKRPETRARRVAETLLRVAAGRKPGM